MSECSVSKDGNHYWVWVYNDQKDGSSVMSCTACYEEKRVRP